MYLYVSYVINLFQIREEPDIYGYEDNNNMRFV